ncbi:copper amine oxidase N-terminal domain-containing protein [Paenibacillus sp. Y412MC10]|uniref:copper amine oxidase N-terminal domain-containing protein n=1 Tax=Geobacillus sp. (strain Y412MC10) TaxID=481743 RepID=UPI0011A1FEFD|nr:copper amine oxidase N-terminal domain-containing protein [Paenibacillus sp. Y412MC10]
MKKLKLLLWITMATTGLEMMGFAMNKSAQAASAPPSVAVQNAEWNQGHLLVPVRPLIEPLGARLEWFPAEKELVIRKNDLTIRLAANFKRAIVETPSRGEFPEYPDLTHREYADMGAPVQVLNGSVYVPLKFVAAALGATVEWDGPSKLATAKLEGIRIQIKPSPSPVSMPGTQKLTSARMKMLSDKLNEVQNLDVKYVSAHYKPYFTDRFIRTLIHEQGLQAAGRYKDPVTLPEYTGKAAATFTQSAPLGNGLTGEDQYIEDRTVTLIWIGWAWKVERVDIRIRTLTTGFAKYAPMN